MKTKAWILSFATSGAVAFILFCGNARAQTMKQMPQRAVKPNVAVEPVYKGKISGFVYWDTTKVETLSLSYDPCTNGIQTIQAFRIISVAPLMNLSEQLGGTINSSKTYSGSFGSCAYTIDNVPVDQPLLVIASLWDGVFVSKTNHDDDGLPAPAPGEKGYVGNLFDAEVMVTVASIPCRDFAPLESPTSMTSGPRSCSAGATNVNFVIEPYSDLKSFFAENKGSVQQLTAAQARTVAQIARLQQKPVSGSLTAQSASPTAAAGGQIPVSTANQRLASPGTQNLGSTPTPRPINAGVPQTAMLGAPAQPLLASGDKPATLAAQTPGATNASLASGARTTMPATGTSTTQAPLTPTNGGSQTGPPPIPSKGHEHNAYDAVTVQRGVTNDPKFTNWANSVEPPNGIVGKPPARGAVLTSNQVLAGPCTGSNLVISALRFEFTTGKDDLRGGDNNLDIEVHFKDNTFQPARNVNNSANWPNGSVKRVDVTLSQPVREDQITEIHLVHSAQAGSLNSQDNWEMTQARVFATGQGKTENIANYGFNDFTGDSPELTIPVSCAPAPGMVNALYFDVVTGSDDLKGDSFNILGSGPDGNNLDVIIGFTNGASEHASDVNGGANWPNNSEHKFFVYFSQPMDFAEIKSITLQTVLQRLGMDKWNMNSVQVTALGNGVNKLIATHGFYRFEENASLNLDMVAH